MEKLKQVEDKYGYNLNGERVITLPFADDFNLVTTDKRRHQIIIYQLQDFTSSMGLKLKPSKCKSLSIRSGKSEDLEFLLGTDKIKSIIRETSHKFLSAILLHHHVEQLLISYIRQDEYKVRLYSGGCLVAVILVGRCGERFDM